MLEKKARNQIIFERFHHQEPNPSTELVYHTPFELLVAVMLSAQTTDKAVNKVTQQLFLVANTHQSLLALGESQLRQYIRSINYYPTKAKNILKVCALLIKQHQGQIPGNRADLEAFPGVGRKTANVVLNTIFGHPTIAVDTHIFRVANRIGLSSGSTPIAVEKDLLAVIPAQYQRHAHHWLVLHGRYICKARKPLCEICLIYDLCDQKL